MCSMKQGDDTISSREEILELASIEAMGMLDEVESARLERAFAAATPAVQAEVLALQERLATDPTLRSSEQPSAALRLRTLAHVVHAIEEDAASAKPIATIGPASGRVPSSATANGSMEELLQEIARRTAAPQSAQLFWRAASFFLIAALAVSSYFQWQTHRQAARITAFAENQLLDDEIRRELRGLEGFDFAAATPVRLRAVGKPSEVTAYIDHENHRVLVVGFRLNEFEQGVTLRVRSEAGTVEPLETVRVSSAAWAKMYDIPAGFGPGSTFEIEAGGVRFVGMIDAASLGESGLSA
jgi:hypothetical protein